jgi:hypothetical protein
LLRRQQLGRQSRFQNNLTLWAGFSVALFIGFGAIVWPGPVESSYFGRLAGRSSVGGLTAAELAGQGVLFAGLAILFGWVAHAAVVVGMAALAGGRSFLGPRPEATTTQAGAWRAAC